MALSFGYEVHVHGDNLHNQAYPDTTFCKVEK